MGRALHPYEVASALGSCAVRPMPTAPVAAASLIAGFAVAVSTGSRPLGGIVLVIGGLWCIQTWRRRHDTRTAMVLGGFGFGAFVISHVLGLVIGAWPSVLFVAAVVAAVTWRQADRHVITSAPTDESDPSTALSV